MGGSTYVEKLIGPELRNDFYKHLKADMPMTDHPIAERYQAWLDHKNGEYAMERCHDLLRGLLSGWPRRSRSVLVFNAGSSRCIEILWEAGFDVTAQDNDKDFLSLARERLGNKVEFVLSSPDHLPFDDCSFDYIVATAALEFWEQPEAVLQEIQRLACSGVILIFPNSWSLFGLECRFRKKNPLCSVAAPLLQSPRRVLSLIRDNFTGDNTVWASVLPFFSWTWNPKGWLSSSNTRQMSVPLGAFVGVRIDMGSQYTGTPLLLPASDPVAGNTALSRANSLSLNTKETHDEHKP